MGELEFEIYLWEDFLASYCPWEHAMIRIWDIIHGCVCLYHGIKIIHCIIVSKHLTNYFLLRDRDRHTANL